MNYSPATIRQVASAYLEPGPDVAKLKFPVARSTGSVRKSSPRRSRRSETIRMLGAR